MDEDTNFSVMPTGWYMFVVQDDPKDVYIRKFMNTFFCSDPEERCCNTRGQRKNVEYVLGAMEMIQSYGVTQGLRLCTNFVHCLGKHARKVHACAIGPLYNISQQDIDKLEHFIAKNIPGITERNIVYVGKFNKTDINSGRFTLLDGGDDGHINNVGLVL